VLQTKVIGVEVLPGDCFEIRSSGGGGWGTPEKRSKQARQIDRELGFVS
jgi:N-methylhydantoinase B